MKNIITTLTALFLAIGATTSAQPGTLDPTFSTDGKVTTVFGTPFSDYGQSVVIQPDGKVLVAGESNNGTDTDFALARYDTYGTLDIGFGVYGKVTTDFGTGDDFGTSVIIDPDGKILVAGYTYNGTNADFALARYNPEGTVDYSFGVNGKVTTDFGTGYDEGWSVTIQPDGKIVVAGYSENGTDTDFAIARYNADGTLDNSFSIDGKVTTAFGAGDDYGTSVTIDPDGKVLVAGYTYNGTNADFAVARYNPDGTLDNSFSVDGKVTTAFGAGDDVGNSVAIQLDGKIVVAGSAYNGSDLDQAVARYNPDGTMDNSFGVEGKVTTDFGTGDDVGNSVAIQPDGKIVVAGSAYNGSDHDLAMARYNPDGTLDNSFDADGKMTTDFGTGNDTGRSVAIRPGGKIVVAGYAYNGSDNDFALARCNADGTLDNGFSLDGKATTDFGTGAAEGYSVAIQPDGKVLVAGYSLNGNSWDFALARYNMDGALDNSFGVDGRVTTDFGIGGHFGRSVTIQPDGKILVAGYAWVGSNRDFALARYNTDGNLDNSFGVDGKVTTDLGTPDDYGYSVAIQPDGQIIVAGYTDNGTDYDFAVARYITEGTLDNSFGVGGKVTTDFGAGNDYGWSVAIQPDGKIIVAGESYNGTDVDFTLVRYTTDGSLDIGFGVNGKVTTDFGTGYDNGRSVVIQPDGRIVVAGYSAGNFALARYNTDGTLDNSFGVDGKVTTTFGTPNDFGRSVAIQPDGKIVVAGYAYVVIDRDFALSRYTTDGTLDNSFGVDGKVTTDFGTNDYGQSVAIEPDGKIVMAGYSYDGSNDHFAVARYLSGLNVGMIEFSLANNAPLIYPNPIDEHVTLEYTLRNDETITIHMVDMQGKIVETFIERQIQPAGEHRQSIDLPEALPSGTYLIAISSPKGKLTVQVVK